MRFFVFLAIVFLLGCEGSNLNRTILKDWQVCFSATKCNSYKTGQDVYKEFDIDNNSSVLLKLPFLHLGERENVCFRNWEDGQNRKHTSLFS